MSSSRTTTGASPSGGGSYPPAGEARRSFTPTLGNLVRIGLLAGLAAALVFSAAALVQFGFELGLLCLLGTAALAATSAPLALRRESELIEPVWFVIGIVAAGVTAKVFYLLWGTPERVRFLLLHKRPEDLLFAALIIAVGLACLSVGYLSGDVRWRLPRVVDRLGGGWDPKRLERVILVLLVLGGGSLAVFIGEVGISFDSLADLSSKRFVRASAGGMAVRGYLRWGVMALEIAFYLVFITWVRSGQSLRSRLGMAMILLAVFALSFPILVSSRLGFMLLLIRATVIWIALRGEPRPRVVLSLVLASVLVMGTMLAARRGISDWDGIRSHIGLMAAADATVGGRYFLDLTKTAHTLDAVPEILDYQYGKTVIAWLVAPIPRSWWPDKPHLGSPPVLADRVFRVRRGSVPVGIVGELYLNFGLAGVFIGLLAAGFLLRSFYSTFRIRFPDPAFVLLYTLLATRLAIDLFSESLSGGMTRLSKDLVTVSIALYFCRPATLGHDRRRASKARQ